MKEAETQVSVHSSHHIPPERLFGRFLFKGDLAQPLWLQPSERSRVQLIERSRPCDRSAAPASLLKLTRE